VTYYRPGDLVDYYTSAQQQRLPLDLRGPHEGPDDWDNVFKGPKWPIGHLGLVIEVLEDLEDETQNVRVALETGCGWCDASEIVLVRRAT
jgi:hypothetical protein